MNKKRIAVVGYGNIGKYTVDALRHSPDMELAGVVRRSVSICPRELSDCPVVEHIDQLDQVDAAVLALPTRKVKEYAVEILSKGIATVDSFDIHGSILELRKTLHEAAVAHQTTAILSAGWDPGSDSVVRMLMQAMVPGGITYTNFGPGMSMGHTVAAKAIPGVDKALSMTIPLGTGVHRRMVYIQPQAGADEAQIRQTLLQDDYFAHDETHVVFTPNVDELIDMGHGVEMVRKGCCGSTQNQLLSFSMRINNPALTAQILVCAARAALRQSRYGAYTLPEIPVIDLLPGERESWIERFC